MKNYSKMTDAQLAGTLAGAYAAYDASDDGSSAENIMFAESEVAERIGLSPDDTARGFSRAAQEAINRFLAENGATPIILR